MSTEPESKYLHLDVTAPAAGRRAHWGHVRKGSPNGPIVARFLLDNYLSTSGEPRTSDEQHAENVAWVERLVNAYNDGVDADEMSRIIQERAPRG